MEIPFKGKISFEEYLWAQKQGKELLHQPEPISRRIVDVVYLAAIIGILSAAVYPHGPFAIGAVITITIALYIWFVKWLKKYHARQRYDALLPLEGSVQETKIILKRPFTEIHLQWGHFQAFLHCETTALLQYENDHLVLSRSHFQTDADWHRCLRILAAGIPTGRGETTL